jgi:hypothetical protein
MILSAPDHHNQHGNRSYRIAQWMDLSAILISQLGSNALRSKYAFRATFLRPAKHEFSIIRLMDSGGDDYYCIAAAMYPTNYDGSKYVVMYIASSSSLNAHSIFAQHS